MNRDVRFIVWLLCSDSSVLLFSYLELKLIVENKLVSDIIKRRTVKNSKSESVVKWPWYIQFGKCTKKFILIIDSYTNSRKRRKNYMRFFVSHKRNVSQLLVLFPFHFLGALKKMFR